MTQDFGTDFASEIVDYVAGGSAFPAAPGTVYVTLYDGAGNELNADVQNGRVAVSTGTGFTDNGTDFENSSEINFGEATSDITVQEVALKDSDAADGTAREFFRAAITNAPQDFATGTRVFLAAGQATFDVLD